MLSGMRRPADGKEQDLLNREATPAMSEIKARKLTPKVDAKSISQEVDAEPREKNNQDPNPLCRYRLVSIEQGSLETSRTEGIWYMYVVSNGTSTITGHRPGPRDQVVEHAEWFVAELNARSGRDCKSISSWRRGRSTRTPPNTNCT